MQSLLTGIALVSAVLSLGLGQAASQQTFFDDGITVYLQEESSVEILSLREYLTDVVLQEMPASFETEALKAQCVAARTFTMQRIYNGGIHEGADICGDPGCCQCYLDEEEGREIYGEDYDEARSKVMECVEETDGQVLVYQNTLIEAVYFSSTGDSTESAAAVWGGEVPYLQSVYSPEEHRITEKSVTLNEFRTALPEADLNGEPAGWFGDMTCTDGGAVASVEIGGTVYSGTTLRSRFGLKSARFTVAVTADAIEFEVTGSGHGVGMSQYGAREMALGGAGFDDIICHYYSGVRLMVKN